VESVIEIELPEPTGQTPMSLELRTTRGRSTTNDAPLHLNDRVVLGEPAVRRLTPETVFGDDELRAFLTAEAGHTTYWLVAFTCTFEHDDELPFATAWLQLNLASDGTTAVAHSMEPVKLANDRTLSWSAKLTAQCTLVQPEIGISGEHTREEVFCEASREGTAQPTWKYFRTSRPIRGLQRMHLVARAPVAGGLSVTVRLGATASHERFGLKPLTYEMPPEAPRLWLQVPAAGSEPA
jgi:hypothetical protein